MRTCLTLLIALGLIGSGLAWQDPPAKKGDPPAKEEAKKDDAKKDDAKKTPAEELKEIQAAFNKNQSDIGAAYGKAKDDAERQKLIADFNKVNAELAERCLKVAEAHADDPAAADLLLLAIGRGRGGASGAKAEDLLISAYVAKADLADIQQKLARANLFNANKVLVALVDRVEKDSAHPKALDLLSLVTNQTQYNPGSPAGKRAGELLFTKFIDSDKLDAFCRSLGNSRDPKATEKLATILEKNPHKNVKAAALLAMANRQLNRRSEWNLPDAKYTETMNQARQYLERIVKEFGDTPIATQAKKDLQDSEVRGIGKITPEIKGEDIDAKEFKISDYRGKVVLLDFWGHW